MYQISQVAEKLRVSTAEIHSMLIEYKAKLGEHVRMEHGIRVVSEDGLAQLGVLLNREEEPALRERVGSEALLTNCKSSKPCKTNGLSIEVLSVKEAVNQRKNELHRLTLESRRLDEAISHYLKILKEDMDDRIRIEDIMDGSLRGRREYDEKGQMDLFATVARTVR